MEPKSLRPGERITRTIRQRLHLRGELMLAALPTATVPR